MQAQPLLLLREDEAERRRREREARDQQRRLEASLRRAHAAQMEAIAAMEEARKILAYPFSSSLAFACEDEARGLTPGEG